MIRNVVDLVSRHENWLISYIRRGLRQQEDALDVMQDLYERLARHHDLDAIENERAFLAKVAHSTLMDYHRRRRARLLDQHDEINSDLPDAGFSAERVLESKQIAVEVRKALDALPQRTRDVFVLRTIRGLKMAEVANAMQVSLSTVEKHHARAIMLLTTALSDKFS